MGETSPQFHQLLYAVASAKCLIEDLPEKDIKDEKTDLLLRSFSFLCHAALEEYLEGLSSFIMSKSFFMFREDGYLRDPMISLCSFYSIPINKIDELKRNSGNYTSLMHAVWEEGEKKHKQAVIDNNGIKTKDQDNLLIPIGCRLFDVDRVLSQNLNSFGEKRGELAHKFRIKTKLPRSALESKIENIIKLLLPFDNIACSRIYEIYK